MTLRIAKIIAASLLLSPLLAAAAVPAGVGFSARIADNGRPVTGNQSFTFTLWDVPTGGVAGVDDVWTEARTIAVSDGVVATTLGDVANGGTALPALNGPALYLEVRMGAVTFSPRIALTSVPYALQAGNVPVIATVQRGFSGVSIGSTCTSNQSVSITVPQSGFVHVTASPWTEQSHVLGTTQAIYVMIGTTATDCTSDTNRQYAYTNGALPAGFYVHPMTVQRVFFVPVAGTYTFYQNGIVDQGFGTGSNTFFQSRMTATFYAN